ncbi:MAG: DUF4445 domain-containing protein [Lachnospiraceae bacterium]|jgi:uncharacterized 2Fe-2S/4Fe-4S cluster protein (DUF4445 family)|nr:DUF4445 domain-containing protein [Lachnospiraceae bacterium]
MAIVTVNGTAYTAAEGTRLGKLLAEEQLMGMPCGGHGRCGKCKVMVQGDVSALSDTERRILSKEEIEEGVRLACCTEVTGDCQVHLAGESAGQIRVLGDMPDISLNPAFREYGFVLDIGTTTLAACLYDVNGKLLAGSSRLNPQSSWGADVISRIEAALGGADAGLAQAVCRAADAMLSELAAGAGIGTEQIDGAVITGNTVMLHLLTGTSAEPLSHAPFAAKRLFGETVSAGELGLKGLRPDTEVYLAPCAAAFVGADLMTAALAGGICRSSRTQLLVDVGTNGEMALWHGGELYCCSTAAGPAFEGAGISMGMGGSPGAVDKVWVEDGRLSAHVLDGCSPKGICGSGIVDAVACLLEIGRIDETGYMEEEPAVIMPPVSLTRKDVRMVQLAKGAIHAGIRTLLFRAGLEPEDVSQLLIAGGFGSYLNAENAGRIGLLPAELVPRIRVIGNGALSGAAMLLLNRESRASCESSAGRAKVLELSTDPVFAEEYMERMMF